MDELTVNAPIGLPKRGAVLVARDVKLERFGLRTADERSNVRLRVNNIPSKTHLSPTEVGLSHRCRGNTSWQPPLNILARVVPPDATSGLA
jgi:hypothetical protein